MEVEEEEEEENENETVREEIVDHTTIMNLEEVVGKKDKKREVVGPAASCIPSSVISESSASALSSLVTPENVHRSQRCLARDESTPGVPNKVDCSLATTPCDDHPCSLSLASPPPPLEDFLDFSCPAPSSVVELLSNTTPMSSGPSSVKSVAWPDSTGGKSPSACQSKGRNISGDAEPCSPGSCVGCGSMQCRLPSRRIRLASLQTTPKAKLVTFPLFSRSTSDSPPAATRPNAHPFVCDAFLEEAKDDEDEDYPSERLEQLVKSPSLSSPPSHRVVLNDDDDHKTTDSRPTVDTPSACDFPSILCLTSATDDRVVPMHSFKFNAALQSFFAEAKTGRRGDCLTAVNGPKTVQGQASLPVVGDKSSSAPVVTSPRSPVALLRVTQNTGHGLGKGTEKAISELVDIFSFIARTVPLEWRD